MIAKLMSAIGLFMICAKVANSGEIPDTLIVKSTDTIITSSANGGADDKMLKFKEGQEAYCQKNDSKAIEIFEDLLKTHGNIMAMDYIHWAQAVDHLGISYGRSGDMENAKRIYSFGIQITPSYPNFYYGMACCFAEMSDKAMAIKYLKMAGQRKDFVIKGKCLPNPRKDSSFKKFLYDYEFLEFLTAHHL